MAEQDNTPPPPHPEEETVVVETKVVRRRLHKHSRRAKDPVIVAANAFFTIAVVVALLALVGLHYGKVWFAGPGPLQADTTIVIPRGSGTSEIAELLQTQGVIAKPSVFKMGVYVEGARGKLQAGEYRIPARASMQDVVDLLQSGKVVEHSITIPEGLTSAQIVARLMAEDALTGEVRDTPVEGSLLPETYNVVRDTPREQLLERMEQAQKKALAEIWMKRDPAIPLRTPQELVTLASIVEKETGVAGERAHVASVYVNRLRKDMKLQSDPTIIYGLVGGKGTLGRPILRSEITRATPYNTYVIEGLPSGPIANPGRASLEATARPLTTKDIFFVADGTGGHAFAETYEEHQKNVAKWREIEKAQSAPPADRVTPEEVPAGAQ